MKKLTFAAVLVAAILALAGCGGGSNMTPSETPDPGPTPEQIEAMALSAAQTAAEAAATDAQTAADMADADADAIAALEPDGEDSLRTMAARGVATDAQVAADRAKAASDNAAAATTSAAAKAFQTTAEAEATTASAHRRSVAGMLTAARQDDSDRTAKAERDANTKVAETKEAAIMQEASQGAGQDPTNDDAGLGGSAADGTAVDTYSMIISRDRSGTEVEIADTALMGEDDPKFSQAMDLGGGTTMHVREMEADDDGNVEDEVVVVTTDIEAPKSVPFAEFQSGIDGATPQALNSDADGQVAAGGDAVAFDPGEALDSAVDADALILANMMAAEFASGTGPSVTHTFYAARGDDISTVDVDESRDAAEVMGTYNGASGTYKCSGTNPCTVTVNDEGELTAASNGWIFTPAKGATSDQPDYVYYRYGFWLQRTKDANGDVTSYDEVETFAGSTDALSNTVADVDGTASYSGGATGVYVHTVINSDGSRAQATSGHFTADASLDATFGQLEEGGFGTIAPNQLNTLTGDINNFDLSGGEDQSWSVGLSGSIASGGTATGTANGDDGSFSASFYGPSAVDTAPHTVVGEFNTDFTNGTIAGAFGASIDDD